MNAVDFDSNPEVQSPHGDFARRAYATNVSLGLRSQKQTVDSASSGSQKSDVIDDTTAKSVVTEE